MKQQKLLSRYWGPFKQEWYHICSAHQGFDSSCNLCLHGKWVNVVTNKFSSFVFKVSPSIWKWWMNRPKIKKNVLTMHKMRINK